jgi:hypothetical protein
MTQISRKIVIYSKSNIGISIMAFFLLSDILVDVAEGAQGHVTPTPLTPKIRKIYE